MTYVLGCIWKLPMWPAARNFCAEQDIFSQEYWRISRKNGAAQREKIRCPGALGVFRYTLEHTGLKVSHLYYLTSEAGIRHHWERNIPRWNPKTTSSPDAYLRSKKQTQRRRNTSGWCNWIQKDKHLKWMLVFLYPTHYVKMCSRCSILLSHSLLESAHSFSSVSTSAFIGKFFL